MKEYQQDSLEIYIDYNRLKAKDLADCLSNLSFISTKIAEDYFSRFDTYIGEDLPTLDIISINTGNSVKLDFVEGWKPRVKTNAEGDIVIVVPKFLGIPIVVGYLLVSTVNGYLDYRNKELDIQIKEIEVQMKEIELKKAIDSSNIGKSFENNISNYIDNHIPEVKPVIHDTLKSVLSNPEINKFRINGIEIKDYNNKNELGKK